MVEDYGKCVIAIVLRRDRPAWRGGLSWITQLLRGVAIVSALLTITLSVSAQVNVTTYHYNNQRTGVNSNETMLTPSNVSATTFGKLFSQTVDGYIFAEPLYVPNLTINGAVHNVVFVATEHDTVYAFDADSNTGANALPLWKTSFLSGGVTTVPSSNLNASDINPEIGITGTPVIDLSTNILYVAAETLENNGTSYVKKFHALDIITGTEKPGSPITISASVTVPGENTVTFDTQWQGQRAGLLLYNGVVYAAFGSHNDNGDWRGWILGYSYNVSTSTFSQVFVFCTEPSSLTGRQAGIWMSGEGLPMDYGSNLFVATGNGQFDTTVIPPVNYGDSILRIDLSKGPTVQDYFSPWDTSTLDSEDRDLGSGGIAILPDQSGPNPHLLVQGQKEGVVFVINRDPGMMGEFNSSTNKVVEELDSSVGGSWGSPIYFNGKVYFWANGDILKAFTVTNGTLPMQPTDSGTVRLGYPGTTPTISANGTSNAVLWALDPGAFSNNGPGGPAILYAYDANNLATGGAAGYLYSSNQNSCDSPGGAIKFAVPTVVNGKVYVGAEGQLSVYGLGGCNPNAPAITSANNTTFTVGTAGSFTVTTTGSPTPSLTETGALPSPVTFKDNGNGTATLSGTPAAGTAGTYPITITANNGMGTAATQSFTLTVSQNQAPTITSANNTTFSVGTAGSFTVTTTGSPTPSLTETGALPSLVTFKDNGNGTATLSGTPAAGTAGTYPITITANNGVGTAATQSFTLTVSGSGGGGSNFAYVPGSVTGINDWGGGSGTTLSVALHQAPKAGDLLLCAATWQSATATASMSDPNNGTWKAIGSAKSGIASLAPYRGQMFYVPSAVSASTTVTLTISSSVLFRAFECAEYSYSGTISLDGTPQYSTTPASGAVATISGLTTSNSNDLVFAACLGVTSTCTTGAGYAALDDTNTFDVASGTFGNSFVGLNGQMIQYKVGVAAGAQSSTFGTGTSNDDVILGLVGVTMVPTAPTITSANNTTFTVGNAGSFTVTTTGSPAPSLTETGALPSPVTFKDNGNGTATLSGTPAAGTAGTYPITITASNGVGTAATQSFTLTVNQNQAPVITSANNTTFTVGTPGSFTVTTTGSPAPSLTETGALPTPVKFRDNGNGTATLSGTPAAGTAGTYPITITASNGVGTAATQSFTLTVNQVPAITSANNTTFTVGTAGSFTVTTTGSPAPSLTETGALPTPVKFKDNGNGTATLSGTPAAGTAGTYPITITASNGVGTAATQSFTLTVNQNQAPVITSANNTTFTVGNAGSFTVTTTGSPAPSLTETGALPSPVTFKDNGNGTATLSGTPAAGTAGTYPITITASNGVGTAATQSFTLTVNQNQAPVITSANNTTFTVGTAGSFTVTTTGSPAPSLTETGALPTPVKFKDNGNGTATLSGTPAAGAAGTYPITITASNGVGTAATQSFTLTVNQVPAITSANNTTFTVGTAGSFTVTTTGSPAPSLTETGALPSLVTFKDNGNGTATLSGTPAAGTAGTYPITITANNGVGTAATQSFTLTVSGSGGGGSNFAYVPGSVTGINDWGGGSGTTLSVALHQAPKAGDLLLCAATWQSATATASMSDPNNGTWKAIGSAKSGIASLAPYRGQMFYVPSAVSASTTVTLTISSSVLFRAFECAEYSYSGTISLDGTPQYSTTPASGAVATISGLTTSNSNDLVFAACLGVTSTCTTGAGYAALDDTNTFDVASGTFGNSFVGLNGQMIQYKVGVAAGAQSSTFGTGTSNDDVILGLVAF